MFLCLTPSFKHWFLQQIMSYLTFTLCGPFLQSEAHRAGTVVTDLHHARWTATAGAALQHHLASWTLRDKTGARRHRGSQGIRL